jgi:hypothetical protein
MTLDQNYSAILAAMPADVDRDDAARVLVYCGKSIAGGIDWPSSDDIDELRAVLGGFGCWFADIQQAIDAANLEPAAADSWQVAWNGCKAMLLQLHLIERQPVQHRHAHLN